MSDKNPYKVAHGNDSKLYVDGPGDGLTYYSGTLYPELRCDTEIEAERAAMIANTAYKEGYLQAQVDIRLALGIKP